jgi:hypothetical protein
MVIDAVKSVIDTVGAFVSRYMSVAEKGVNAKELKVPVMDVLVSPK